MNDCKNTIDGLILEKSSSVEAAVVGEIIQFSIAAINQSDQVLKNVIIMDNLPTSLEFISGSVYLGMTNLPAADIWTGINVGDLLPGQIKRIKFSVKVISRPTNGMMTNVATGKFDCLVPDPSGLNGLNNQSNTVTLPVDEVEVRLNKKADREEVVTGDAILYTVQIQNTGTLDVKNTVFKDVFDNQYTLVPGSFKVNGQPASMTVNNQGGKIVIEASLGTLMPTESRLVTYQIKVERGSCSKVIANEAYVTFDYGVKGGACGSRISDKVICEVAIANNSFKQFSVDGYLTIPAVKPDIEEINTITGTADVISCHVITTPVAQSVEGQSLTGYKLVVTGKLNLSIEYTSLSETQQVHSAQYSEIFSNFIILPEAYQPGSKIDVEILIEDIYYQVMDIRNFFKNVTMLINAKLQCCTTN